MDESLAFNETCSETKFHVYWYHNSCLQQEEEEEVEHGQIHFSITLDVSGIFI